MSLSRHGPSRWTQQLWSCDGSCCINQVPLNIEDFHSEHIIRCLHPDGSTGMSGILWISYPCKNGALFRMFHIHQDCIQNKNFQNSPKFYSLSLYIWIQISHLQVSGIKIIPKYSPITSHAPHFPPCQASRPSKPRSKIPQEVLETTRPERQRGC